MFVAKAGSGSDREKLSVKQTDEVASNLQFFRQKSNISASIVQISDSNGATSSDISPITAFSGAGYACLS